MCVLNPSGRKCMCQAGYKLAEDGTTCKFSYFAFMNLNCRILEKLTRKFEIFFIED